MQVSELVLVLITYVLVLEIGVRSCRKLNEKFNGGCGCSAPKIFEGLSNKEKFHGGGGHRSGRHRRRAYMYGGFPAYGGYWNQPPVVVVNSDPIGGKYFRQRRECGRLCDAAGKKCAKFNFDYGRCRLIGADGQVTSDQVLD